VMAARASGVMESIEAFMAEWIVRPLIIGNVNNLKSSHRLADLDLRPHRERHLRSRRGGRGG
jgi:ribosomal protein S12 methylthiotransferase accessory factor YcaO